MNGYILLVKNYVGRRNKMKKNLVTITTLITLGLIPFAKPALSNLNPLNIIVAIAGNVQIKRPQWTEYKLVSIGTFS